MLYFMVVVWLDWGGCGWWVFEYYCFQYVGCYYVFVVGDDFGLWFGYE